MIDRVIIVGDIHGCLEEFDELLKAVEFKKGKDNLILAGDLVDRGPDPHGVVRRAQELEAICILGNHDEAQLRWHHYETARKERGTANPMRPFTGDKLWTYQQLTQEDFDFIKGFIPHYSFSWWQRNQLVVHGGLLPKPLHEQPLSDIIRRRWIHKDTHKSLKFGPNYSDPVDGIFWTELWDSYDENPFEWVFYGHHVWPDQNPKITARTIGLDTGCCFGGRLTAAILMQDSEMHFASIKAKRAYSASKLKGFGE